ncbi:MAG: DUF3794 domain-containing protein [Lachnospiraceae bacterium]
MEVSILYVTSDDSMPFAVMEGDVPFSHLIEVENAGGNCRFSLHAGLEQLSAAMIDSEEIEVKAGVSLNAFVAREEKGFFLTDVQEKSWISPESRKCRVLWGILSRRATRSGTSRAPASRRRKKSVSGTIWRQRKPCREPVSSF